MADETPAKTVSIVVFLKRKPGITTEQFFDHWANVHGPLVKPWAEKHGFLEYRQIHLAAALNGERAAVGPEKAGTSAVLEEWDGCATFELPSLEQFEAAFQDPYYINLISKDEETFVDKKRGVIRRRGYTNRVI